MWNAVPIQVSIDSMKSFNNRAHSIGTANLLIFYIIFSNKKLNISVICFSHDFTEVNYFKYLVSLCVGEKITRDTESRKIFFLKVCLLVLVNKGYTKCMQYISCKIKRLMFWKLTVLLKTQLILLLYYGKKNRIQSLVCYRTLSLLGTSLADVSLNTLQKLTHPGFIAWGVQHRH